MQTDSIDAIDLRPEAARASFTPVLVYDNVYKFTVPWHWMEALLDDKVSKEGFFVAMNYERTVCFFEAYPTIGDIINASSEIGTADQIRKGVADLLEAGALKWFQRPEDEPRYIFYADSFS